MRKPRLAGAAALGAGVAAAVGAVVVEGQDERLSAAFFGLSFVLVGIWITLMILEWRDRDG